MEKTGYKNILIIKPSALGDIAIALPALMSLRKSFPDAKITWMIRPEYAPLLEGVDALDEVMIFDRKLLGGWFYQPKAFGALLNFIKALRNGGFDLVVDLQGLLRTALFSWFSGCPKRFGMKTAREFATIFYTDSVEQADTIHVIDYYKKIVDAAGASVLTNEYGLRPTSEAAERTKLLLQQYGLENGSYAVLVPRAAHAHKCWPPEYFAALADRIHFTLGLSIATVGSASEKTEIQKLVSMAKAPIANFAGLTDISQLTALLDKTKIVVSNDTGPGHIAVALKKKVVMIFGLTNPSRIQPYNIENSVAAIEPDVRGTAIETTDAKYSIDNVTVDKVYQLVRKQLEQADSKD